MSWNYRVCKTTTTGVYGNDKPWTNISYAMHEAFYNSDGEIWAITENPVTVGTDTSPGSDQETEDECLLAIESVLDLMHGAIHKSVVDLDNIVYADQDGTDDE